MLGEVRGKDWGILMVITDGAGGVRRRREGLAARQARVGIVANPRRVVMQRPVPREVWTRWPDLRASIRRKAKKVARPPQPDDCAAFDAFVRSVRRTAPTPDCMEEIEKDADPVPDGRGAGRRTAIWLLAGGAALAAAVLTWFSLSLGSPLDMVLRLPTL